MPFFDLFDSSLSSITAPEFPEGLHWFNSLPLSLKRLKGKVILIDFWAYSCINCQRTLPYLKAWWEKYQRSNFLIIGVHTPEFEFEKDPENVKQALKKYHVDYPIVQDNDYLIWNSYSNHYWPAKYLINHLGKIIYSHHGEGNYLETELEIQKAIKETGVKIDETTTQNLLEESFQSGQTSEIYCGFARGQLGNVEGYQSEKNYNYTLPEKIASDTIFLKGVWRAEKEYLEHGRSSKDLVDLVVLSYRAKKVYLVMESAEKKPIKVYITLDGVRPDEVKAGTDLRYDEEGRAFILVQFSALYNLINTPTFGDHILRISSLEKGLRCFAFTFGS